MSSPQAMDKNDGCLPGCGLLVLAVLVGAVALGAAAAVFVSLVQMGWEAVR